MGKGTLGKFLAVFFALMVIGGSFAGEICFKPISRLPSLSNFLNIQHPDAGFYFGIFLAILVGIVIIGGIKRIGKVAERIVPLMAVIYVGAALVIIVMNFNLIPEAVMQIIKSAFTPDAAVGGFIGVLIQGFRTEELFQMKPE